MFNPRYYFSPATHLDYNDGEGKEEMKLPILSTTELPSTVVLPVLPSKTWEEFTRRYLSPDEATVPSALQGGRYLLRSPKEFLFLQLLTEPTLKTGLPSVFAKLEAASKKEIQLAIDAVNAIVAADSNTSIRDVAWLPVDTLKEFVARYLGTATLIDLLQHAKLIHAVSDLKQLLQNTTMFNAPVTSTIANASVSRRIELYETIENENNLTAWLQLTGRPWTPELWSEKLKWITKLPKFAAMTAMQKAQLRKLERIDNSIRTMFYYYVISATSESSASGYDGDGHYALQYGEHHSYSDGEDHDNNGSDQVDFYDVCPHCSRPIVYLQ